MKKLLFATISLCLAAAITAAPVTAYANDALAPEYPEIYDEPMPFSALTDFAIADENLVVFAENNTVVHWQNEIKTVYDIAATDLDYDAVSGNFYYSTDGGATGYILPDDPDGLPGEKAEHDFSAPCTFPKTIGGYYYFFDKYENKNIFSVLDDGASDGEKITKFENFYQPKVYGDKLYAICDNCLYSIVGTEATPIEFTYSNYDELTKISVGDIPEKLKAYSTFAENPMVVNIENGASVTELDLNLLAELTGDAYEAATLTFLPIDEPRQATHTDIKGTALLLYASDNARIVAQGNSCYILKASQAPDLTTLKRTAVDEGTQATVNTAGEYAHALPYMSNATRAFALAPNEVVTVLYLFESADNSPLAHDFYLVENGEGDRGYIAAEFLEIDLPLFDEGGASVLPDPDAKTDDYIRTVVLVIIVIVLVLIAAGYLTWVGTAGKRQTATKKDADDIELDGKNGKK